MNKKTSIIALSILVAAAVFFGYIFVNKGDGPVMGMIVSDRAIEDTRSYKLQESSPGKESYLILTTEFNKLTEKFKAEIPNGKNLYSNINIVECPKGLQFTAKWVSDNKSIKEETKPLTTNQSGIISYLLEANLANKGSYSFELYNEGKKIFEKNFKIE